jgi:hypothetical protein
MHRILLVVASFCLTSPLAVAAPRFEEAPGTHVLRGPHVIDARGGPATYVTPPIFLRGSIAQATGVVSLRFSGVAADPGAEAEIYLPDQQGRFDTSQLIGVIQADPKASSRALGDIVLEVRDFTSAGQQHLARTLLRDQAHLSIAVQGKNGLVTIESMTLSATNAPHKLEKRGPPAPCRRRVHSKTVETKQGRVPGR